MSSSITWIDSLLSQGAWNPWLWSILHSPQCTKVNWDIVEVAIAQNQPRIYLCQKTHFALCYFAFASPQEPRFKISFFKYSIQKHHSMYQSQQEHVYWYLLDQWEDIQHLGGMETQFAVSHCHLIPVICNTLPLKQLYLWKGNHFSFPWKKRTILIGNQTTWENVQREGADFLQQCLQYQAIANHVSCDRL